MWLRIRWFQWTVFGGRWRNKKKQGGLQLAAGSVQRTDARFSLFVVVNKETAACRIRRDVGIPIATSLRRRRPFIPIRRTLKPVTVRHFGNLFHPLKHPPPTYEYLWGHAVLKCYINVPSCSADHKMARLESRRERYWTNKLFCFVITYDYAF